MLKRIICLLLAGLLLIPCVFAEEEPTLDEQFSALFKRYKTTGAVLTIAKDGEIIYQLNYGYTDKKTGETVTDDTYFRLASVTKMITAIHVMQLVEQEKLALDADISDYFGYTIRNPYYKKEPITLRQLMSHTSSIYAGGGYVNDPDGYVWKMLSLERSRTANYYKQKPGSKYAYSNFGAGLMGSLIELATGKNFGQSVEEGLFAPLGIDAAYNVNLGTLDGVTILQPETVYEMMSSQEGKPGVTCDSKYGLCIYRKSELLEDRIVYGHQGMSDGVVAGLFFDPESQLVFSLITNGSDSRMDSYMTIIIRKLFALTWETFGDPAVK